jgi:Holin of 3TMs, for gene-transfer release
MSLLSVLPTLNLLAGRLIDYIPDPAEKARAAEEFQEKLLALAQANDAGQAAIDRSEAGNASLFVAGWRPAIGWVCAACLALYYLPSFVIGEVFWVEACWRAHGVAARPELGISDVTGLLASLLGLGTMRTIEKLQGVARGRI